MSKKLFILFAALVTGAQNVQAQAAYIFSQYTAAYAELALSSKVGIATGWSSPFTYPVQYQSLGIKLFGQVADQTQFIINSKGQVQFDGAFSGDQLYASAMGINSYGSANDVAASVSYEMDSTGPGHIVKVQFKNVGFADDDTAHHNALNYQIWLYQGTNIVEFRYGPNTLTGALTDIPNVGIFDVNINTINSIQLYGNPASPVVNTGDYHIPELNGFPAANTVYRFTPANEAVPNITNHDNISATYYHMQGRIDLLVSGNSGLSYVLYNMSGQVIRSGQLLQTNETSVSTAGLAAGVYLLKVITNEEVSTKKILIN